MKRNVVKIISIVVCLTFLLSGCSLMGSKNSIGFQSNSIAGLVQSVNDGTITLLIGEIKDAPSNNDNQQTDDTSDIPEESEEETETPENEEISNTEEAELTTENQQTENAENSDTENLETENEEITDTSEESSSDKDEIDILTNGVVPTEDYFVASSVSATLTLGDTSVLFKGSSDTAVGIEEIVAGDVLKISLGDDNEISRVEIITIPVLTEINGINYLTANNMYTDNEFSDETFESTTDNENAIIVSGSSTVGFDGVSIKRSSANSNGGIVSQTYGVGAALLVADGRSYIINSTIDTDANGATGIFSYGNSETYSSNTQIVTESNDSCGLMSNSGKLAAWDMTISTSGDNSSAIKSVNNGGVIVANGGTYSTSGSNSPALFSSADLAVNEITASSSNSNIACVEGKNSLYIFDSELSSTLADEDSSAIFVYQNDNDTSNSRSIFSMVDGSLDVKTAGVIYTTNTQSKITLSNVEITTEDDCEYFLKCSGNDGLYGESGSNGASCIFTGFNQKMNGDVIWDSSSKLDFYMQNESILTGSINNCNEDENGKGYCKVYISEDSKWVVTADSVITELYCAGEIIDSEGNTVTVKDTDGKTLVKGDSDITVTVESFENEVSFEGATVVPAWEDYKIDRPSGI